MSSTPLASSIAAALGGGTSSTSSTTSTTNSSLNMTPADFINIMVTQLENQDPLDPTSSSDLLQQVSEIGQLSSTDQLQTSLQSMTMQSQIGSASSLIGKSITGLDPNGNATTGTVDSVQVQSSGAYLSLSNGDTVSLTNVQTIGAASATPTSPASAAATPAAASTTPASTPTNAAA